MPHPGRRRCDRVGTRQLPGCPILVAVFGDRVGTRQLPGCPILVAVFGDRVGTRQLPGCPILVAIFGDRVGTRQLPGCPILVAAVATGWERAILCKARSPNMRKPPSHAFTIIPTQQQTPRSAL